MNPVNISDLTAALEEAAQAPQRVEPDPAAGVLIRQRLVLDEEINRIDRMLATKAAEARRWLTHYEMKPPPVGDIF